MDSKEYYNNQKQQRKSFKNYRKHMLKLLGSSLVGMAAAFAIPWRVLFNFLLKFTTEYIAGSVTIWTQIALMAFCGIKAVYHTYKAAKEKVKMDNLQGSEEDMVDSLINENDNLLKKVDSLENEKVKTKEEVKTTTKSYDNFTKTDNAITQENTKGKRKSLTR